MLEYVLQSSGIQSHTSDQCQSVQLWQLNNKYFCGVLIQYFSSSKCSVVPEQDIAIVDITACSCLVLDINKIACKLNFLEISHLAITKHQELHVAFRI